MMAYRLSKFDPIHEHTNHFLHARPSATVSASVAAAVHRKRLRGADLRNRLAAVVATGRRLLRGLPGSVAGDLYGRDVSGEPAVSEIRLHQPTSFASVCAAGTGHRRHGHRGTVP